MSEGVVLIKAKVKEMEESQQKFRAEIEALCEQFQEQAWIGDYGNGETYYPTGTNAEEHYITYVCGDYDVDIDENGLTTEGLWISSSQMC